MNFLDSLLSFERVWAHDRKRKSYLLTSINFVLTGFLLFIIFAGLNPNIFFHLPIGESFLFFLFLIYLFFTLLSFLIKKGFIRLATFSSIALLLFALFKITLSLGVDFYIADIMYPLIILISAILVDAKFAIFVCLFIFLMFFLIFFLQSNQLVTIDFSWRTSTPAFSNLLIVSLAYVLTAFLTWLSFKEFETRIKKLKQSQLEKLIKLAPLLDLGKLSSSLACEIRNHLSVISIVLQNFEAKKVGIRDLDLAFEAVEQIDKLSSLGFCGLANKAELEVFNLNLEIKNIISLFKNKSRKQKIKIIFEPNANYQLHADRMKLSKILVSLILNAIESYKNVKSDDKNIFIKLVKKPRNLLIKVKDYGVGVSKTDLPLIFTPYFTSKDRTKSLGLSLYASQKAMGEIYETKIRAESLLGVGSTFTLYIKNKFLLI